MHFNQSVCNVVKVSVEKRHYCFIDLQGSLNNFLLKLVCCTQLVIYGVNGNIVAAENMLNYTLTGGIHNLTNYLITLLAPGGPSVPISAVILAVQRNNGTAEVAAAFNEAVAAGYIPQLEALLKQASLLLLMPNAVQHDVTAICQ